jgi:hypothetical protein
VLLSSERLLRQPGGVEGLCLASESAPTDDRSLSPFDDVPLSLLHGRSALHSMAPKAYPLKPWTPLMDPVL